jgi:predicted transcriptional regulator of viral defense system
MRNKGNTKIGKIIEVAKQLPIFTLDDLASIETDRKYLRVLLSRHVKSGNVVRLKKGMYAAQDYLDRVDKTGRAHAYAEFLAGVLYKPSYLSLEYVLHQHGVITEMPTAVTVVTRKKTASFTTPFGNFQYHSIKPSLFVGFTSKRDGDYLIFRASLAKAFFDFLYFRKNQLADESAISELRLNLEALNGSDKTELARYVELEGSVRVKKIHKILWKK